MTLNKLLGIILFLYLPFSSLAAQQQYAYAPVSINQSINKAFDLPYERLNTKINTQRLQFEQKERERLEELVILNKPITEISTISKSDLLWLEEVEDLLKKEITNNNFHFDQLANQLFISRSQLQRRIKKITGLTPNKYFREIRLQSARNLLESSEVRTISETAYAVGFDTPKDLFLVVAQFIGLTGKATCLINPMGDYLHFDHPMP